jgi:predicted lipid-binding transport protein (Tim44 family)
MKKLLTLALALFAATAFIASDGAEAKRMGGGKSLGTQRQVTPTPPAAAGAAPSAAAPAAAIPGKAAPAPASGSRWLGPLAGLAAGIGLAALFSHLGLSEGFGNILLLALLVGGAFVLVRLFLARRSPAQPAMQYAGTGASPGPFTPPAPAAPSSLSAGGNFDPVFGGAPTPAASPAAPAGKFPPGFDPAPLAEQAKIQFRRLQAAYDSGDTNALAGVMRPEMFAEVAKEIAARGSHTPTEIVALDANVLEVTTEGGQHWASVHFTGQTREDGVLLPSRFDEIWNLAKPVDGSTGWLLAGIQQIA